jgi:hypothetical protein
MDSKLGLASAETWQAYYRAADKRRRSKGWHRRSENSRPKRRLTPTRALAIVIGLATLAVAVCIVIPS